MPRHLYMLFVCLAAGHAGAAEIDVSKLPPSTPRTIDFAADVRPILEASCVRCHGAERPKSGFSLVTREAALRGGDGGVAIVPGDSANSALIHYVAGLVPDMQMPPEGKGVPLTSEQISVLRAWIDQGVAWQSASNLNAISFSVAPALRWVTVNGNAQKFQEHHWIRRGVSGGAAEFRLSQTLTNGVSVVVEGRALTDDYKVTLEVRRPDVGFSRFGFEQFRRYYNDTGPHYPFAPSGFATQVQRIFDLDRELHMDTGKAFAEFGVTLPRWPHITVGYEYQYRDGTKSTEQWGPVTQITGGSNFVRNIYPAYKQVDEDVHVVRVDVTHDIAGVAVEDNFRAEFTDLKTKRVNETSFTAGNLYPDAFTITRETHDQFQWANSLHGGKAVYDWLFVSAGYLFSELNADATLRQNTADALGRAAPGTFWAGRDIVLEESSHVFNANGQAGPWNDVTVALGLQAAFSEATGFGQTDLQEGDPNDPTFPVSEPAMVRNDTDRAAVSETLMLRYTGVPFTSLFADTRLKQEEIGRWEEQNGGEHDFLGDTDVQDNWQEYRTGFDLSPWRRASLHGAYKKRLYRSDYDHDRDEQPHGSPGEGYSSFIRSRDSDTDLVEARLVMRPSSWVKATLSYQWAQTEYETAMDAVNTAAVTPPRGSVFAGRHDSSTYSANLTFVPWQRWSISATFSYQESRIESHDNGSEAVAPYDGNLCTVLLSTTYSINAKTDLNTSYSYSRARYGQDHFAAGLPLGIDYDLHAVQCGIRRRLSTNASASVSYGLFDYDEPTAHGFNDYTAHMIFALIAVRLP